MGLVPVGQNCAGGGTIQLLLAPPPQGCYFPGSDIIGEVRFTVNSPALKLKSVRLKLKGQSWSHWSTGSGENQSTHGQITPLFPDVTCLLAGDSRGVGGDVLLHAGEQVFPFRLQLPSLRTLPPSYYGDSDGGVRYILKATADIPWARDPAVRHQLQVANPDHITGFAQQPLQQPLAQELTMPLATFCCFGDSGVAVLRLALPQGALPTASPTPRQLTLLCGIAASTSKVLQHAVLELTSVHTLKAGMSSSTRRRTLAERVLGASDGVLTAVAQGCPLPKTELVPITLPCTLAEPTIESPAFTIKIHAELVLKVPAYCFNPCVVLPLPVTSFDAAAMTSAIVSETPMPFMGQAPASDGAHIIPPMMMTMVGTHQQTPQQHQQQQQQQQYVQPYAQPAIPLTQQPFLVPIGGGGGAGALPVVAIPVGAPLVQQGYGQQSYGFPTADSGFVGSGSDALAGDGWQQQSAPRQIVVGTTTGGDSSSVPQKSV